MSDESKRTWLTHPGKPGVIYREHPTRKTARKPDRFWAIRHRAGGKRLVETLGWTSEGWTADMAKMRKTEFLQELREALDGEVSASVIQSNISYYDQYISQEAAKGRREEEVIEEIGSPRLIAKTIIDSSEGAGETGQGGSYTSGDAAGSGRTASSYNGGFSERDDSGLPPNFHYIDLNKWYWKVILSVVVIAILFVLFALVGGIFTILIHLAGPILLIWLIYTFIKNIWK